MSITLLLAEAFAYPYPGQVEWLEKGLRESGKVSGREREARSQLAAFTKKVKALSLSEWEELATRTLDLSPAAAPYIGFQVWGESYQRGEFMAKLNHAMLALGVDTEGELPDHIAPVLVYLEAAGGGPIPELVENFEPAVKRMIAILREKDKNNPYVGLFEAVLKVAPQATIQEMGGKQ